MKTKCPWCQQQYEIEKSMIGADVQCQSCGKDFFIDEYDVFDVDTPYQQIESEVAEENTRQEKTDPVNVPTEQFSCIEETKTEFKPLTCDMCGGTDIVKKDGVFVCQSCGTKYSVEEAKKMMISGTVNVAGTVKIDMSEKLRNLYTIARRAKDEENSENAAKYYDLIIREDPESWEASFYLVYYKAMSCKIAEISAAASSVENCLKNVLQLVLKRISDKNERENIFTEITTRSICIANMLGNAATNHFNDIGTEIRDQFVQGYIYNVSASAGICYTWGDLLESINEPSHLSCVAWETAINLHKEYIRFCADKNSNKAMLEKYAAKICRIEPNYKLPEIPTESGCYIATAVYGSYDCPQVWTLRRYRDNTLATTWLGRCFISIYYAISPVLVRCFGNNKLFISSWKKVLDKMVQRLNEKGVSDLPYHDR